MSVQAIVWVLEEAPISKPSHIPVLMSLANEADSEGKGAFPSQRTMAWQTRKTERAVRKDLDAMEEDGLIRRGDQERAAYIAADRRPIVWDLAIERTRDMSKRPTKRPASGWDGKHRTTDDVDRTEPEGTTGPPDTEPQVKTGGTTGPGGTGRSNRGELEGRTGGNHSSADPEIYPRDDTHTGNAEPDNAADPRTETGVCVDPETKQELKAVLRANLIDRPQASLQKEVGDGTKIAMIDIAERCLRAGATVEDIDVALSKAINTKTEYPYTHGTRALESLLARREGREDPLGSSKKNRSKTNSWIDSEGFEWPHHEPYARACGGQSCGDWQGQRYVAMVEQFRADGSPLGLRPVDGTPFSCPVCKEEYKTTTAA